jgi:hypothetical protein
VIRLVSLVAVVAGLALLFLVVVPWLNRRHQQKAFEDQEKREITRFQNQGAREDLTRVRRRINEDQDRMREDGSARVGYALATLAFLGLGIFAATYLITNLR